VNSKFQKHCSVVFQNSSASERLLRERCSNRDKEFFKHIFDCGVQFDTSALLDFAATAGLVDIIKFFVNDLKVDVDSSSNASLAVLLEEQSKELHSLDGSFEQMQRLFVGLQAGIATAMKNQEHIHKLILKQELRKSPGLRQSQEHLQS